MRRLFLLSDSALHLSYRLAQPADVLFDVQSGLGKKRLPGLPALAWMTLD